MACPLWGLLRIDDTEFSFVPKQSTKSKSKHNNKPQPIILNNFLLNAPTLHASHNVAQRWMIQRTFLQQYQDIITIQYMTHWATLLGATNPAFLSNFHSEQFLRN